MSSVLTPSSILVSAAVSVPDCTYVDHLERLQRDAGFMIRPNVRAFLEPMTSSPREQRCSVGGEFLYLEDDVEMQGQSRRSISRFCAENRLVSPSWFLCALLQWSELRVPQGRLIVCPTPIADCLFLMAYNSKEAPVLTGLFGRNNQIRRGNYIALY